MSKNKIKIKQSNNKRKSWISISDRGNDIVYEKKTFFDFFPLILQHKGADRAVAPVLKNAKELILATKAKYKI